MKGMLLSGVYLGASHGILCLKNLEAEVLTNPQSFVKSKYVLLFARAVDRLL
jgi:hypothetical protein